MTEPSAPSPERHGEERGRRPGHSQRVRGKGKVSVAKGWKWSHQCTELVPDSRYPIFTPNPMRECGNKPMYDDMPRSEKRCKKHTGADSARKAR